MCQPLKQSSSHPCGAFRRDKKGLEMSVEGEGSADAATPLTRPTVVRAVAEALKDQLPRLAAKETSDGNTSTDSRGERHRRHW